MGLVIQTTPGKFERLVNKRLAAMPGYIRRGMHAGAMRGKTYIVRRTPKDRGNAKAAWDVRPSRLGYIKGGGNLVLMNDAPYAGVLEVGARPHAVSREGVLSIAGWVRRNLRYLTTRQKVRKVKGMNVRPKKFGEDEALRIAYAIAQHIKKHGQPPTYFVLRSLPELQKIMGTEIDRWVTKLSKVKRPR